MPIDEICFEAEERMEKAVELLHNDVRTIRTGRATTALVDHLKVEYYGTPTPLQQLANVAVPDPQLLVIRPYDPAALKDIEKAILQSELGLTPQNDGRFIRLPIPPLSEERRKQLAGQVRNMGEQAKVAIRNVRRDANRHIDQEQKDSKLSEDEAFRGKSDVQELTGEYEEKADEIIEAKTAEIMEM